MANKPPPHKSTSTSKSANVDKKPTLQTPPALVTATKATTPPAATAYNAFTYTTSVPPPTRFGDKLSSGGTTNTNATAGVADTNSSKNGGLAATYANSSSSSSDYTLNSLLLSSNSSVFSSPGSSCSVFGGSSPNAVGAGSGLMSLTNALKTNGFKSCAMDAAVEKVTTYKNFDFPKVGNGNRPLDIFDTASTIEFLDGVKLPNGSLGGSVFSDENDNMQHFWDTRMKDIADAMNYLQLI